ncbi:MAG: hypothetical protein ACI4RN_01355 [Oscillospiraceae bacterium]
MLHGYIDIPTIYFFEEKNVWTGSIYDNFNYKIIPQQKDDKKELFAVVWNGKKCFELITPDDYIIEMHEELTAEGLDKITERINKAIQDFKDNNYSF